MEQQDLFLQSSRYSPQELSDFLNDAAPAPVRLNITRNRVNMVSVVFEPDESVKVRVHEAYLAAPRQVLKALRSFLRTRRKTYWQVVSDFAGSINASALPGRRRRYRTRGTIYDLAAIRDDVNRHFFQSRLKCRIGWGRRRTARRQSRTRSIRFGSYRKEDGLVLINPRLDSSDVPAEFIRYIVFHEMLHAAVPSVRSNGRWNHHPPEYRKFERQFPDWERMQAISKRLVG